MLSVIMLSVITLSVVAPKNTAGESFIKCGSAERTNNLSEEKFEI